MWSQVFGLGEHSLNLVETLWLQGGREVLIDIYLLVMFL